MSPPSKSLDGFDLKQNKMDNLHKEAKKSNLILICVFQQFTSDFSFFVSFYSIWKLQLAFLSLLKED